MVKIQMELVLPEPLKKTKFNFSNKSIYILGAGGASYGIISELIKKVEKIYVTNRTKQKTIQL